MKNGHFLVFLAVWVLFPKFLGMYETMRESHIEPFGSFSLCFWAGEGVAYIRIAWNGKSGTCSWESNGFYFVLWYRSAARSPQNVAVSDIYAIFGFFP